ncbi:unnamed protein product [Discula destructiva]
MATRFPLERPVQRSIFSVTLVFSTLAVVCVLLRVLGRFKLRRPLDCSDYVMIGSLLAMLGQAIAILDAIFSTGLGFHVYEIEGRFGDESGHLEFLKHLLVARLTATVSMALNKISILILCCRVFTSKRLHLIANLTIGLITVWAIGCIVIDLKICKPIQYIWDKSIDGTCGPDTEFYITTGVINIIAGLIVLVLPMPYIYKLQLAAYKKITLMFTFGIGFFVCVVSVVKVALLAHVNFADVTWSIQNALILSILETSLAIIVACIPVLRPLFKNSLITRAARSRYISRNMSVVAPGQNGGSKGFGFTELRTQFAGHDRVPSADEPLPMQPEKTYYNRIEAVGRSSDEGNGRDDVEMWGITVKTEFTASVEVVEVLNNQGRSLVRQCEPGSLSKINEMGR